MEIPEDKIKELESISKLLNGQIRGVLNKVASETNLSLIQLTLSDVFSRGLNFGYEIGKSEAIKDEIKKELGDKN